MAETREQILISIEIEKGQGEKEIDNLTRKITDLQIATANLQKQNNELIKQGKQNSEEYIENTRQIEINKQKINESVASRKGLIQTLAAEDNSIKALNVRNAELKKQRDLVTTATAEGRAEIARINKEIDDNNTIIKANVSAQEKQRLGVGGYTEALDKLVPGLGATVKGIQDMTKAALVFIATPLGAVLAVIALGIAAVIQYFKRTEEGGDALNKILFTMDAVLGNIGDAAAAVGKAIFDAFNNPKQAIIDFGTFLQDQIINRLVGMLTLMPKLLAATELLFAGRFKEAATVAGDAIGQVVLGIENATEKVQGFIDGISDSVNDAIAQGARLAALDKLLGDQEEALTVQRSKTALEVGKLREDALRQEGEIRKATIKEAIALEQTLADAEVANRITRLKQAKEQQEVDGITGETKLEVAKAEAAVLDAQAARFQATLRFQKELAALDEAELKAKEKLAQEEVELARKTAAEIAEAEKQQFENNLTALESQHEAKLDLLKEAYLNDLISKEEFEDQFSVLEFEALEARKAFLIANMMDTAAVETAILDKQIKKKEETAAKEALINKKSQENEKAIVNAKINLANQLGAFLQAMAGKNKALAVAGVIIQKAAAIAQIIAQTAIANAQAVATFWITGGLPWTAINTALAVLSIGSVVGEAATSISQINSAKRGGILKRGGIAQTGGVLRGPSHARGGIPFTVGGVSGFEAEGDEAIINKRSTKMFKPLLSQINQAGGGVAFGLGGVTRYQTGSIVGGSTRQASQVAESRTSVRDAFLLAMEHMKPPIVTVEDINARQDEVADQTNKALVL